jgi:CBS domain-containing protein
MRTPPITALPNDNVQYVINKMVKFNIGSIVISDDEIDYGLITEKDVINNLLIAEKKINQIVAKEIMSSPLLKIKHDAPLKEILDKMQKQEIRRLVVVKDEKIVGIVTERRILEALI